MNFQLMLLFKYADYITPSDPDNEIEGIMAIFNSYYHHLQLTIGCQSKCSVPFLDTRVTRTRNNMTMLDWYIKHTSTGRYMNYHSYLDLSIKSNVMLRLNIGYYSK